MDWAVHGWTLFAFIAVASKISRFTPNLIGVRQSSVSDRWNTFVQNKTGAPSISHTCPGRRHNLRRRYLGAIDAKEKSGLHLVSQNCPSLDTESQERTTSAYVAHITF